MISRGMRMQALAIDIRDTDTHSGREARKHTLRNTLGTAAVFSGSEQTAGSCCLTAAFQLSRSQDIVKRLLNPSMGYLPGQIMTLEKCVLELRSVGTIQN